MGLVAALAAPASATTLTTHAETIHTTAHHPWLTADHGWVPAGLLRPGEPVVTLDGATGTVAWVHVVPGQTEMYNLTVTTDHTYGVGDGQWVVHNVGCGGNASPSKGSIGVATAQDFMQVQRYPQLHQEVTLLH
jgi:hypothetical protein